MFKRLLKIFVLSTFLLLIISTFIYAQADLIGKNQTFNMKWGGIDNGWKDIFELTDTKIQGGPYGRLDVVLSDNSFKADKDTELLLHFDRCTRDSIDVNSDNYTIDRVNIYPSKNIKKFGDGSCGFLNYDNFIRLNPINESILLNHTLLDSFVIDFYIFPLSVLDGTTVLAYYAPIVELDGKPSGLKAFFNDGSLHWEFKNVFKIKDGKYVDVRISENKLTPVDEWHHHAIYYNSKNGLLTSFFDGKLSGLEWLTESREESGTILRGGFSPTLNVPLEIGDSFLGYIDEFRIKRIRKEISPSNKSLEKLLFNLGKYRDKGEIKSKVIDLKNSGSKLIKANWGSVEDNGTAIRVYYRSSCEYFREIDIKPEWEILKNDKVVTDISNRGRFFQWKAVLYGTEKIYTPYLLSLDIEFEYNPFPIAPYLLRIVPIDGGVQLFWMKNRENDVKGNKIYYGGSSGYYFGKGSSISDSPSFVGDIDSMKINNLENEKVYFFSITAVDNSDQESGFSKELIARPSNIYGK